MIERLPTGLRLLARSNESTPPERWYECVSLGTVRVYSRIEHLVVLVEDTILANHSKFATNLFLRPEDLKDMWGEAS